MNCARVSISGGQDKLDSLPTMFVANLASINSCKTTEQTNLQFPDPGKNLITASPLNYPAQAPVGCPGGSGSGSTPASKGGAAPAGSAPATTSAPAANQGGVFAPGAAGPTTMATSASAAAAPGPSAAAAASPPAAAPPAAPAAADGSCQNGAVPCTASGFYCVDTTHYGMCNFGCAIPMSMAAGTQCTNGAVSAMAVNKKRASRRSMRHVHKRHLGDSF